MYEDEGYVEIPRDELMKYAKPYERKKIPELLDEIDILRYFEPHPNSRFTFSYTPYFYYDEDEDAFTFELIGETYDDRDPFNTEEDTLIGVRQNILFDTITEMLEGVINYIEAQREMDKDYYG